MAHSFRSAPAGDSPDAPDMSAPGADGLLFSSFRSAPGASSAETNFEHSEAPVSLAWALAAERAAAGRGTTATAGHFVASFAACGCWAARGAARGCTGGREGSSTSSCDQYFLRTLASSRSARRFLADPARTTRAAFAARDDDEEEGFSHTLRSATAAMPTEFAAVRAERALSVRDSFRPPVAPPASAPVAVASASAAEPSLGEVLLQSVMRSSVAEVARLLEAGANPGYQRADGVTGLHIAATTGHVETLRTLLRAGSPVDAKNSSQDTPLIVAASKARLEAVRTLLEAGANVAWKRTNNATALHVAAAAGAADVAGALLKYGAEMDARNAAQDTPLIVAAASNHTPVARVLLDFRDPEGRGVDVNARRENGASALHFACTRGNLELAALLLEHLADANLGNHSQDTPLIVAADAGHEAICELLLCHGADAKQGRVNGATALHVAAGRGFLGIVNLLLEKAHVPVDVMNKDRETPLLVALARGRAEVAHRLLAAGASAEVLSEHGVTVYDLAIRDIALWRLVLRSTNSVGFLLRQTASFQRIISVLFDLAKRGDVAFMIHLLAYTVNGRRELRNYFVWLIDRYRERLRGVPEELGAHVLAFISDATATSDALRAKLEAEHSSTATTPTTTHEDPRRGKSGSDGDALGGTAAGGGGGGGRGGEFD